MKAPIIAGGALMLALAACSPPAAENAADTAATNNTAVADKPAPEARDKSPEEAFADAVAAANTFEIAAGTLAEQKGESAAVRAFGKKIAFDHNQSTMKLKMAAKDVDGGLFIDPTLSAEQENNIRTLEKASGPDFDAAFAQQQIAAHTRMIALVDAYRLNGKQQPLTTFAAYQMSPLRAHLAQAKAL